MTKLLPRLQSGPYQWQINDPADTTPWSQPWEIGVVEDAPEEEWNPEFEEVVGDNLGSTIQDLLFQGGNFFVSLVVQEFGTMAYRALQPFYNRSQVPADLNQAMGDGGLMSVGMFARATTHDTPSRVADFRLRATALHPDFSSQVPYQIYFNSVTIAPNQPATYRRGSRLKNLPVRFLIMPEYEYRTGGNPDPVGGTPDLTGPLQFYQTVQAQP